MASGKYAYWVAKSDTLPIDENDDVYRPSIEPDNCANLKEGLGDNAEILGDNVEATGVSVDLENINLSFSNGNNSDMSNGKRKSVGLGEKNEVNKKMKVPASKKIVDAISRIASESHSIVVNTLINSGTSIGEVMAKIQNMDVITSDVDLHNRCCHLMIFKLAREMSIALKGNEGRLLEWLKFATYNPLPFMKT